MSEQDLKERIGEMAYYVPQQNGTEPPFNGKCDRLLWRWIYVDIVSGEPLFSSKDKFDSGCGWPAFAKPIKEESVRENVDTSYGMVRREVRSKQGDSHLGHVFPDGPRVLGGLRYCINSASLRFIPYEKLEEEGYGEYKKIFE